MLFFSVPLQGKGSGKSGGTVHVNGYFRKNGTYVAPHYRTAPNSTKNDNWSTKGNINPYTGKPGTKTGDSYYEDNSQFHSSNPSQDEQQSKQLQIPKNAQLDYTSQNWVCNSGYRKNADQCVKFDVPENAQLDYTGRNWVCNSGYRKNADQCVKFDVPDNAQLDYTSQNWVCNSGYRKNADQCVKLDIPDNAQLDYTGRNWVCNSGFKRSAESCEQIGS